MIWFAGQHQAPLQPDVIHNLLVNHIKELGLAIPGQEQQAELAIQCRWIWAFSIENIVQMMVKNRGRLGHAIIVVKLIIWPRIIGNDWARVLNNSMRKGAFMGAYEQREYHPYGYGSIVPLPPPSPPVSGNSRQGIDAEPKN